MHPQPYEGAVSDAKEDDEWVADCMKWRGRLLTGKHSHWCNDWDGLPIDETTDEWPCVCCRDGACAEKPEGET